MPQRLDDLALPETARNQWLMQWLTQCLTQWLAQMPGACVVERNFFCGFDAQGAAFWSAGCRNKEAWAIRIRDDAKGSTRVLSAGR